MKNLLQSFVLAGFLISFHFSFGQGPLNVVDTICQNGSVSLYAFGTGHWTALNPPTGGIVTIDSPMVDTTLVTGFTVPGNYGFVWANAGGNDTQYVVVLPNPNAGPHRTAPCYVTDSATMAAIGTGIWSAAPTNPGNSVIVTPGSPTTVIKGFSSPGTYFYYWTSTSGCSDTVSIGVGSIRNDVCGTATSIGTLATPPACAGTGTITYGTTTHLTGQSNLCSSPELPYPYQLACPVNLSSPPNDVWYSFVASSTRACIVVSGSTIANPIINVWAGTCGSLQGIGCSTGSAGVDSLTVFQLTPGTTYYVQISGQDSSQNGNFSLSAYASTDCDACLVSSYVTMIPPPVNGTYAPGQTVEICYTVSNYNQTSANWLHGITTYWGSGWDSSSFRVDSIPPSCAGGGFWGWYRGDTSSATSAIYGQGFYYLTPSGRSGPVDSLNCGNNFGDDDISSCTWTFCIQLTVARDTGCGATNPAANNLNVNFYATGDGQSGSWGSFACDHDPSVTSYNHLACCPPTLYTQAATCNHPNGTATCVPAGHNGPWKIAWSNGRVFHNVTDSITITGLPAGLYTVSVTDIYGCVSTATDSVKAGLHPNGGPTQYLGCVTVDTVQMSGIGIGIWSNISGPVPTTILQPDSSNTLITGLNAAGTYRYQWAIASCYDTVSVIVTLHPNAGPNQATCPNGTVRMGAVGTGHWYNGSGNPATVTFANPTSDSSWVTGFTAGGTYTLVWRTQAGCSDSMQVTVTPFTLSMAGATTICNFSNTTISVSPSPPLLGPFNITWLDSNMVMSPHSDTTQINPLGASHTFVVMVTDAGGCVLFDSVTVNTNGTQGTPIQALATPRVLCAPGPIQLVVQSHPDSCGLASSTCTSTPSTGTIGIGTTIQGGSVSQYPSPYGNYYHGARHQFLIHASELQTLLPAGGQISSIAFDVGSLPQATTVTNLTIEMACTTSDTMSNQYIGGLVQVYNAASYTVTTGWNIHTFTTPYNWDGHSNLVVDICFHKTTGGVTNPKMVYTQTPFRSVWCTYNNTAAGVCNRVGTQAYALNTNLLFDRPNMQFNVCAQNLSSSTVLWSPNSGPGAVTIDNADTTNAIPTATTVYTVQVTNGAGCISYSSVQVIVDSGATLTFNNDTFLCGPHPIILQASIHGASVPPDSIFYSWSASNGGSPPSGLGHTFAGGMITPSATTTYSVTASLPGGCSLTDTMRVTYGAGVPSTTFVDSITCAGANNGIIAVHPVGGHPPFTYTWTPAGANVDSLSNLGPNTYMVTYQDSLGCTGADTFILASPAALTLRLDSANILCFGQTSGNVAAIVTGGRPGPGYTYSWSPPSGNVDTLFNLGAGTYALTVTDTSGCTISGAVNVVQPTQLVSSATSTNLTGWGLNNGTITVSASGGTGAYSYSSSPAVAGLPNATGLDTGTYIITVCDANLCCAHDTVVITSPPPIILTFTTVNLQCAGQCIGQVTANVSGGVPPYSYSWTTVPPAGVIGTANSLSGLCGGTYAVTVTDSNGVQVTKDTIVTTPAVLTVVIDTTHLITCYNANNGGLNAIASGGTPFYTYIWSPAGSNPLTNIGQGTYTIQVTDMNGCTVTASASLNQPTQVTATIISEDSVTCFGLSNGFANVLAAGGTAPYSYSWSGSTSIDSFANNLAAGPQTVTVTDANGCTASVSFNIGQPTQLSILSIDTVSAHCSTSHDGSAIANVSGGTSPYSYTWGANPPTSVDSSTGLNPGSYTLTVTDANGCTQNGGFIINIQYTFVVFMDSDSVSCNGGNDGLAWVVLPANGTLPYRYSWNPSSSTGDSALALSMGMQNVTVTDIYGCTASNSVSIPQPNALTDQVYFENPLCFGQNDGKIWVTASGTRPQYTYSCSGITHVYQITDTVTGLAAGAYTLTITDGKGCSRTDNATLSYPSALTLSAPSVVGIGCADQADGSISISASGATPPYSYAWSPGGYSSSTESNLGPGIYTITVTDANGCSVTVSVPLPSPPPIQFTFTLSDSTSCPDTSDGHIVVNVIGGTPGNNVPYMYSIKGSPYQQNHNFYNLSAGAYTIAVTDSPGCVADTIISVYQPLPLTVAINPQDSTIDLGSSVLLVTVLNNPGAQTINSYYWTPGTGLSCTDCPNPVATPYQNTAYGLLVNYGKNCTTTATDNINVGRGPGIYIPSAFTPNGDGNNDQFMVYGATLASVGMTVYNRWGEKVFDSGDSQWAIWDGTYRGAMQPPGVYVYFVQLVYLDGTRETKQGSISLIR